MTNYQKSISYLDYLENGMKIRNAGFVKTEENNGKMRLEVRVKNLPDMYSGQFDLQADCGGIVGRISLNRGSGSCCIVWDKTESDGDKGVEAGGIYLRLQNRRLVQTVWPVPVRLAVRQQTQRLEGISPFKETEADIDRTAGEITSTDEVPERVSEYPVKDSEIVEVWPAEEPEVMAVQSAEEQESMTAQPVQASETMAVQTEPQLPAREHYYSDKWEQLTHMYPMIHPFGDEREYLSITPGEFVILRSEFYKMVHNSFLLHGFYNYHHLLLGQIQEKGEWHYYLGVPGNFYTREKMVAEMFGFEAFEGEKNPASPGDFGYYMKRVEI